MADSGRIPYPLICQESNQMSVEMQRVGRDSDESMEQPAPMYASDGQRRRNEQTEIVVLSWRAS